MLSFRAKALKLYLEDSVCLSNEHRTTTQAVRRTWVPSSSIDRALSQASGDNIHRSSSLVRTDTQQRLMGWQFERAATKRDEKSKPNSEHKRANVYGDAESILAGEPRKQIEIS